MAYPFITRTIPCRWPSSISAGHYSPAAAYAQGDFVKIGQYLATGRTGGAYDMGIWLILRHGTTLVKASDSSALTGVDWSVSSPAAAGISGARITMRTAGQAPPASGAALAAAYAAISNGTAGFNLSDLSIAVSQQWAAGGSLPNGSSFSKEGFEGTDRYYFCKRTIPASSNAPVSIGAYGEHPLNPAYWDPLPTDFTPSGYAGVRRTDCQAENPFDAALCGRCGRAL